ncbi:MAG: D-alanyl-D-alanine carboxypeptidase/D-alanyl-D-alanine-endopeptidase, partial [Coleofasciculaceae cyanobacterium]
TGFLLLFFNIQVPAGLATDNLNLGQNSVAQTAIPSKSICRNQLKTAIDEVINRPQFRRARWGILIESLLPTSTNNTLYNYDAERFFIPASNVKLLTTAAALSQLGASFQIRTSVYQISEGVLRLVGRGDPSLQDAQLKDLAQQLKRQGITNIRQLIVNDGYFQGDSINLTWDWQDVQSDYGTAVNSLILNQNAVELTLLPQQVGQPLRVSWTDKIASRQWQIENTSVTAAVGTKDSLTVTAVLGQPLLQIQGTLAVNADAEIIGLPIINPAQYFLANFREVLAAEGISVAQVSVVSSQDTAEVKEVATIKSPPLAILLKETNQDSNNLYAEVLLRSLGVSNRGDSTELGVRKIAETLTTLGVNPESYNLIDGSGLSRQNLVSPQAIVQTLKGMAKTLESSIYRDSLSTAGVNGTLRRRFLNTLAAGRLQAKTGTLTGVSALSGYLDIPGFQPVVFSLMVNQSNQSSTIQRQAIDEIVLLLTRIRSC